MVCAVFVLGALALLCLEENTGMSVYAYIIEVESLEAVDVMNGVVENVEFGGANVGAVVGASDRDCCACSKKRVWLRSVKTRWLYPLGEGFVSHGGEEKI